MRIWMPVRVGREDVAPFFFHNLDGEDGAAEAQREGEKGHIA